MNPYDLNSDEFELQQFYVSLKKANSLEQVSSSPYLSHFQNQLNCIYEYDTPVI